MALRDVLEFIVDGTSGLVPGDISGKAMVVGVCSLGVPGKVYYLGKSSNLEGLLGQGPLVDCLGDIFSTMGQEATVLAVPVTGSASGIITPVKHVGTGPEAVATGTAAQNGNFVVKITVGGALGTAKYKLSEDGGVTWGDEATTDSGGTIALGTSGVTLILGSGTHVVDDTYAVTVQTSIGPVSKTGTGADVTVSGTVKCAGEVLFRVVTGGARNAATYRLSLDGGDTYAPERTVPLDGIVAVGSTGATILVPDSPDLVAGDVYSFSLLAPVASISTVVDAIEQPLHLVDPEFVHVVGASNSTDWAVLGTLADSQWNKHRPTFFTCEARLPYPNETLDDWVSSLVAEKAGYAHRFVSVCSAFGEISDTRGLSLTRNAGGLMVGRLLSIPVQRAIGRVRDGGISQLKLPDLYTESMQSTLEDAGYVTAKRYASLASCYWGDAKTLADVTSDYQYLEVLRVVFKAIRLLRIQALKSMYDEAGDVLLGADAPGLAYLKANLENALDTMTSAIPQELAAHVVHIPGNQDIVNNGVAVEVTLIGIPIIRTIKLYASYVYAGSRFDPRLKEEAA